LGDRLGRWPARPAVGGKALRLVEGGGVEAGPPGKARGGKRIALGESVNRGPDGFVRQHGQAPGQEYMPCLVMRQRQAVQTMTVRSQWLVAPATHGRDDVLREARTPDPPSLPQRRGLREQPSSLWCGPSRPSW